MYWLLIEGYLSDMLSCLSSCTTFSQQQWVHLTPPSNNLQHNKLLQGRQRITLLPKSTHASTNCLQIENTSSSPLYLFVTSAGSLPGPTGVTTLCSELRGAYKKDRETPKAQRLHPDSGDVFSQWNNASWQTGTSHLCVTLFFLSSLHTSVRLGRRPFVPKHKLWEQTAQMWDQHEKLHRANVIRSLDSQLVLLQLVRVRVMEIATWSDKTLNVNQTSIEDKIDVQRITESFKRIFLSCIFNTKP